MIDLLSDEQVQIFIEQRRQEFKLNNGYYVLTSLNHVFYFWDDGYFCITDLSCSFNPPSYQPEIAKLYDAEYDRHGAILIKSSKTRKRLYELFISDPECLFFIKWHELKQELLDRGLV